MLGPKGIRRLLMAIALIAYGFALLPGYDFLVLALGFDCVLAWLFLFYPRLSDLTEGAADNDPSAAPSAITVVDEVIFAVVVGLAYFLWPEAFGLPDEVVPFTIATIIATAMVTVGAFISLLPYDQYARVRPSWTVASPEAWFVTNRLLGYGSCPLAIAYIACYPAFPLFWLLTLVTLISWLFVPALLSYLYERKHQQAS